MNKLRITLVFKKESALTSWLYNQLTPVQWLDCDKCLFHEIATIRNSDFYLTVLEDTPFQEILDVCDFYRNSNKNSIYLSTWNNSLIAGPTHFPGNTAALDSCFFFLKQTEIGRIPTEEELLGMTTSTLDQEQLQKIVDICYAALSELIHEMKLIYLNRPGQKLKFIDKAQIFDLAQKEEIRAVSKYIFPLFEGMVSGAPEYKVLLSKYQHSRSHIESNLFMDMPEREDSQDRYRNVAVIGGGTAGYLAALSLKKAHPWLPVTLIESSKVPVIGVGEATTPEIRRYLFGELGLSAVEFYRKVKPTWKLGIKFFWGQPGDSYFNYPFGKSDIRSAYLVNGDINFCSLTSMLMSNNSSFVVSSVDKNNFESFLSLSNDISYALHLDNASFIGYLKEKALEAGIIYVDDLIVGAELKSSLNEISHVVGESGVKYQFDFFIDSSGFKSLLLEKTLLSPFIPFRSSLFTDTAVTGRIANSDKVKPYTYAESMDHGWCWNIPMRGEDHRGYVFSSDYCSVDKAAEELAAKNPAIEGFKTVKFRSGRHGSICIGNVFAVGNSYAFVEPLESTGIHMIIKEVEILAKNFSLLKKSPAIARVINDNMNDHWEYLKGFLSIHYKYNKKFETDFWRDCREHADVSSVQWLVDLYHEVGLLSYAGANLREIITKEIKDDIFGLLGFDTLLLGQGVVPKKFEKSLKNKSIWEANVKTWKSIQSLTVPLEQDLKILIQHPELI
jgi:tryptophan 7-halogenase